MLTEQQAIAKLAADEIVLPRLKVTLLEVQPTIEDRFRPDWTLEVRWEGRPARYGVEYKSANTPKSLAGAAEQILTITRGADDLLPMVMAPYLSEDKLGSLLDRGVSGVDFCGNAAVLNPGNWLVLLSGKPNLYPDTAPIKKIFSGTSSLVGRVLMQRRQFSRLRDVQEAVEEGGAEISLGTISKVVSSLEEELIVSKREGIRLVQPDLLLDRLVDGYDVEPPRRVRGRFPDRFFEDSSFEGPALLEDMTAWADRSSARFAVSGERLFAGVTSSDVLPPIYTDQVDRLSAQFGFQANDRFANAELRETTSPLVYFQSRAEEGVRYQSALQTYIELRRGGKRDRELAEPLRQRVLEGADV